MYFIESWQTWLAPFKNHSWASGEEKFKSQLGNQNSPNGVKVTVVYAQKTFNFTLWSNFLFNDRPFSTWSLSNCSVNPLVQWKSQHWVENSLLNKVPWIAIATTGDLFHQNKLSTSEYKNNFQKIKMILIKKFNKQDILEESDFDLRSSTLDLARLYDPYAVLNWKMWYAKSYSWMQK